MTTLQIYFLLTSSYTLFIQWLGIGLANNWQNASSGSYNQNDIRVRWLYIRITSIHHDSTAVESKDWRPNTRKSNPLDRATCIFNQRDSLTSHPCQSHKVLGWENGWPLRETDCLPFSQISEKPGSYPQEQQLWCTMLVPCINKIWICQIRNMERSIKNKSKICSYKIPPRTTPKGFASEASPIVAIWIRKDN